MSLKKTGFLCGISTLLLFGYLGVSAEEINSENTSPSSSPEASSEPGTTKSNHGQQMKAQREEMKAQREQMRTENQGKIKERAKAAIEKRLNSLNVAKTRLDGAKSIGSEYRSMIKGSIDVASSGLTNLKSSIDNESDPAKIKELIPKITWDYRVYKTELPKNRGLISVATAKSVLNKLDASIAKIEEGLSKAATNGVSITDLQQDLAGIKSKLAGIESDISAAETEFLAMKPAKETSEADDHLSKGKEYLKSAKQKMIEVKNQLRRLVPEIRKAVKEKLGTPAPKASSSPTGENLQSIQ